MTTPIVIVGPTASGKSALGVAIAQLVGGEVVNTDSMQLYRGMDIGTAKLTPEERCGIRHHQLDVLDVTARASVARYQREATRDVEDIRARGKVPVLVGGSMLYIQALIDEWQFPPTDSQVRAKWEAEQRRVGTVGLHRRLGEIDPEAAAIIEPNDPRRTVRALEVIELTGRPFKASQPNKDAPPRWGALLLGLHTEPAWLHERIDRRTQTMFDAGFIDEVKALSAAGLRKESTAGRAIGYSQVLDYLDPRGAITSTAEALEGTTLGTRRYVRRQRAWFRRDKRIQWIDAASPHVVDLALRILDTHHNPSDGDERS